MLVAGVEYSLSETVLLVLGVVTDEMDSLVAWTADLRGLPRPRLGGAD